MRRYISKEEKGIALRMSLESGLSNEKIAPQDNEAYMPALWETGEIVRRAVVSDCPKVLNSLDATVGASPHFQDLIFSFLSFFDGLGELRPPQQQLPHLDAES